MATTSTAWLAETSWTGEGSPRTEIAEPNKVPMAGRGFRNLLATAERYENLEGISRATSPVDWLGSLQPFK